MSYNECLCQICPEPGEEKYQDNYWPIKRTGVAIGSCNYSVFSDVTPYEAEAAKVILYAASDGVDIWSQWPAVGSELTADLLYETTPALILKAGGEIGTINNVFTGNDGNTWIEVYNQSLDNTASATGVNYGYVLWDESFIDLTTLIKQMCAWEAGTIVPKVDLENAAASAAESKAAGDLITGVPNWVLVVGGAVALVGIGIGTAALKK